MDKTWKKFERWVGEFLTELGDTASRVPITGRTRGSAPDVTSDYLSIECKYRKSIPGWIKEAMEQAVASSRDGKTPVVFIKENESEIMEQVIGFEIWHTNKNKLELIAIYGKDQLEEARNSILGTKDILQYILKGGEKVTENEA